ncbi:protein SOB FIVE-LIKE 6-like [Vicia villosa]|uniref:protein SOB FIVE-LIKE 6-like n=1 Tax=Vicia villosa TaxID=3911 RepID=UPI00273A9995|nr:protein SOB FIVE-LIKE 6-like [Vicia villosa]
MDKSISQYSNASESGWTHYLDQSSISESYVQRKSENVEYEGKRTRMKKEEKFEEDSSMVSDASSGPPHYDNEEYYYENLYHHCLSTTNKESNKKKKVKESNKKKKVKECDKSQQSSHLDDTASSPYFNCPNKSHKKQDSFSKNGAVENAFQFATRIKLRVIR